MDNLLSKGDKKWLLKLGYSSDSVIEIIPYGDEVILDTYRNPHTGRLTDIYSRNYKIYLKSGECFKVVFNRYTLKIAIINIYKLSRYLFIFKKWVPVHTERILLDQYK